MTKEILLSLVYLISLCQAFYFPGLTPVHYCAPYYETENCKAAIPLSVNRLNSEETLLPYDNHYFDICSSAESSAAENFGQVVFGDRIRDFPYRIEFLKPKECQIVCIKKYSKDDKESMRKLNNLKQGIRLHYQQHWFVDDLPVTWCYDFEGEKQYCSTGFPLGCYSQEHELCETFYGKPRTYYIYNHVDLIIKYHSGKREDWGSLGLDKIGRIISVRVIPRSINHRASLAPDCSKNEPLEIPSRDLKDGEEFDITYSYSVKFEENDMIKWSSRWDHILESAAHGSIQWFSILNSAVIVLFLAGLLVTMMLKNFRTEINNYIKINSGEESQEEPNWKLLYRDVFRPPRNGLLLSVLLGSGIQIFIMAFVTLTFACLGFFHPAKRGVLATCALVLYFCLGTPAGFTSALIYKSFGGDNWKKNALLTSMLIPGFVFFLFIVMNFVHCEKESSAAIPFSTLVALLALWFGILVPLTFVGAYFGFRIKPLKNPVQANPIPRNIPKQSFFTKLIPGMAMGGVLPFGCIFVQLFLILNSIWSSQIYNSFGYLFLVFVILVITCFENSIFLCYTQLSAEDYHWWWRSFLTSGFTAFYMFVYCIYYFVAKLNIEDAASTFLYFGYTFIVVFLFFLLTGTIGFFACFWYVRKIYSSVDVDFGSYYEKEWSPDIEFEPNDKVLNSIQVSEKKSPQKGINVTESNSEIIMKKVDGVELKIQQ